MQVDFYQLGESPVEQVVASIAEKVLAGDGRLLIVGEDEGFLVRLDRMLWDTGPTSFLPHALAGGPEDAGSRCFFQRAQMLRTARATC